MGPRTLLHVAAAAGFALAIACLPACGVDHAGLADGMRRTVSGETPAWVERSAVGRRLWAAERAFYDARGYRPAWVNGTRPTLEMHELLQQLRLAGRHGLDPARYGTELLEQISRESRTRLWGTRFPVERVPELDARLTYAYLAYASDLLGSSSDPDDLTPHAANGAKKDDPAARLTAALEARRVGDELETFAPAHRQYKGLQAALAREQHAPTGEADRLRMNLERWRWVARDLGDRHFVINIPAYTLFAIERDAPRFAMRIVVGKPATPTPLFSDEMTEVVFSPYWNIPESILLTETLPHVLRDPAFLARNRMEVVRGTRVIDPASVDWSDPAAERLRIRQRPGPGNALGLVKFVFPNHFDVYLHDTPEDGLFRRERRTFSHGCIRVEDPVGLASYVLRHQPEWTAERIAAAMRSGREQVVKLKEPVPVHIGYWTAWVNPDGSVSFSDDPYGLDQVHARLLATRSRSTGPHSPL